MLRTPAILQVTDFVGLSRRSPHRFTLCVSGCGSLPAHIRISRVRASSSYLLPSKSHPVSYARFACDESCLRLRRAYLITCISYGLLRASHSRNPTGIRISRVRASSSYLLPSKSHTVSYTRFACDDPVCVFEELIHLHQMRARKNTDG